MSDVAVWTEPNSGATVIDQSGVDSDVVRHALIENKMVQAISEWSQQVTGRRRRTGGLLERDRYVTPNKIFEKFRVAYDAAERDDVVSGAIESSESLAFSKQQFFHPDADQEDAWNQWAAEVNLDAAMRQVWRENAKVSNVYVGMFWGRRTYRVRGEGEQRKRRKEFNLRVPISLSVLDPFKIVPVGNVIFGERRLAYIADRDEIKALEESTDETILSLIDEKYDPTQQEVRELNQLGVTETRNLYLLNQDNVWRHTATRSSYERIAAVRLESVFELLDLKHQLRQMDRATLIGAASFIILIRKGAKDRDATPQEILALQEQATRLATVPIIVGDDRLSVDIITPTIDNTLSPDRHNTIDARLSARLYKMFFTGGATAGSRTDDTLKLARVVARGLESDRLMQRRSFEANVFRKMVERNSDQFDTMPKLTFHPKRISLDFDSAQAQLFLALRERGDMSRDSALDEVGLDQFQEFIQRKREKEKYDDAFDNITPWGQPGAGEDPRSAGRNQGGNRNGGGSNPDAGGPPKDGVEKET